MISLQRAFKRSRAHLFWKNLDTALFFSYYFRAKFGRSHHRVNTAQIPTIIYGLNPELEAASCVWEAGLVISVR